MKSFTSISYSLLVCISLLAGMHTNLSAQAQVKKQGDQTLILVVPGNCGMCKARIESTAMDVAGVKKAEWDMKTDTLIVIGLAKMDKQKVADALAKAGYGSDLAKADPKGYNKLPACCQYDTGAKKE